MPHYHRVLRRSFCLLLVLCLLAPLAGCAKKQPPVSSTAQPTSAAPTTDTEFYDPERDTHPYESEYEETEPDDGTEPETEEIPPETEPIPADVNLGGFAVSTSTAESTRVGMQILSSGGNAVDAAAAISFMLSVSEPYSSGIGGSGIMLIYDSKTGKSHTLDYYGCAGSAANNVDQISVPGLVAGMDEALRRWGTMSLADVIQPSIDYAEQGFTVSDAFIYRLTFSDNLRRYNPAFTKLQAGDVLHQYDLAETFRKIQSGGADAFYRGEIAQDIVARSALTMEDLANYQVHVRSTVKTDFAGWQILGAWGPASGLTVCQMLRVAEMLDIPDPQAAPDDYLRVLNRATTVAYQSRYSHVVDPEFYKFRTKRYLTDEYLQGRIDTLRSASWTDDPEKECTTQFAVLDNNGLLVCVTNSLSNSWGSYRCVDGFYLNNALINFSKTGRNAYEPGKRPRTHFSPTICLGPNGEMLTIGSPGGVEIPKLIVPVLIDILRNGTDVQTAVDKARCFFDSDGYLCLEGEDMHPSILNLKEMEGNMYYYSNSHLIFGCTSVVGYSPSSGIYAVSDQRRDTSLAMVYNFNP